MSTWWTAFLLWMVPRWLFLEEGSPPEPCISSEENREENKRSKRGNPSLGAVSLGQVWIHWTQAHCAPSLGSRMRCCVKLGCSASLLSEFTFWPFLGALPIRKVSGGRQDLPLKLFLSQQLKKIKSQWICVCPRNCLRPRTHVADLGAPPGNVGVFFMSLNPRSQSLGLDELWSHFKLLPTA